MGCPLALNRGGGEVRVLVIPDVLIKHGTRDTRPGTLSIIQYMSKSIMTIEYDKYGNGANESHLGQMKYVSSSLLFDTNC